MVERSVIRDFADSAKGRIAALIFLTVLWILLHAFTLSRDLPSFSEHAPDGVPPQPYYTAMQMMTNNTCKYPPLQHQFYSLFSKSMTESQYHAMQPEERREATSRRILTFRFINSVMGFGLVLLVFFFGIQVLHLSTVNAFPAAALFSLLNPILYYSQTSNMDIPYTFWMMAAVLAAALGEQFSLREKRLAVLCHLTCGILIANAFCTKDQAYAYLVLPALAFTAWRRKTTGSWKKGITPILLWGIAFVPAVLFIYTVSGGWTDVAKPHFEWIFGSGKNDFQAYAAGLGGRMRLLADDLLHLAQAADYALLLLIAAALIAWWKQNGEKKRRLVPFFCGTGLLYLSAELFLFQVLRNSYVRFMIPILPFLCLGAFLLLEQTAERHKHVCWILVPVFLLQTASAVQTLYNMKHSTISQVAAYTKSNTQRIATVTAGHGEMFLYAEDGSILRKRAYRSWQAGKYDFGLHPVPDIPPDDFFLRIFVPDVLLVPEAVRNGDSVVSDWIRAGIYSVKTVIRPVSIIPQTWQIPAEEHAVLIRNPRGPFPRQDSFPGWDLEQQLIALEFVMHQIELNRNALPVFGAMLASCKTPPDRIRYAISDNTMDFAEAAYLAAGRKKDALMLRTGKK